MDFLEWTTYLLNKPLIFSKEFIVQLASNKDPIMKNLKLTPIDWLINSRQKKIFWAYLDELIIENDMIHMGYAMLIPE